MLYSFHYHVSRIEALPFVNERYDSVRDVSLFRRVHARTRKNIPGYAVCNPNHVTKAAQGNDASSKRNGCRQVLRGKFRIDSMTGTLDADVNEVGGLNRGNFKLARLHWQARECQCDQEDHLLHANSPDICTRAGTRFNSSILDTAQNQMFPLFDWSDGIPPR